MKFSMIVVTTSWAPVHAFSAPGMKPHAAPKRAPAPMATGIAIQGDAPATAAPTAAAPRAPRRNWPWAPILNSPALKPSPTAMPREDERCRGDDREHDAADTAERALEQVRSRP